MAKRSGTLETTLLAIELLRRIPRSGKISAPELQRQLAEAGFERDLRSIQRTLKQLCGHFDIECDDTSKPHGYRWLSNAKGLAIANLSAQESMLLMMAQEHLRNLLPPKLMKSMEGYFRQAQRNLALGDAGILEKQWPQKVRVIPTSQPLLPPKISPATFETVSEALYANKWLKLDYQGANGKHTQANIMPLGLAQRGGVIYLACRYEGYDNERSIALHRIVSAEMMTLGFERPKGFDLRKYDEDGRFSHGNGVKVKLSFRTDADNAYYLDETPLSEDQVITLRKDGDMEVTATVVDSVLLEWWIKGFGERVWGVKKVTIG